MNTEKEHSLYLPSVPMVKWTKAPRESYRNIIKLDLLRVIAIKLKNRVCFYLLSIIGSWIWSICDLKLNYMVELIRDFCGKKTRHDPGQVLRESDSKWRVNNIFFCSKFLEETVECNLIIWKFQLSLCQSLQDPGRFQSLYWERLLTEITIGSI